MSDSAEAGIIAHSRVDTFGSDRESQRCQNPRGAGVGEAGSAVLFHTEVGRRKRWRIWSPVGDAQSYLTTTTSSVRSISTIPISNRYPLFSQATVLDVVVEPGDDVLAAGLVASRHFDGHESVVLVFQPRLLKRVQLRRIQHAGAGELRGCVLALRLCPLDHAYALFMGRASEAEYGSLIDWMRPLGRRSWRPRNSGCRAALHAYASAVESAAMDQSRCPALLRQTANAFRSSGLLALFPSTFPDARSGQSPVGRLRADQHSASSGKAHQRSEECCSPDRRDIFGSDPFPPRCLPSAPGVEHDDRTEVVGVGERANTPRR